MNGILQRRRGATAIRVGRLGLRGTRRRPTALDEERRSLQGLAGHCERSGITFPRRAAPGALDGGFRS